MNKREFEAFIKHVMSDLSIAEQEKLIDKICWSWCPEIYKKFNDNLNAKYLKCPKCKKYISRKYFSIESTEVKECGVLILRDCGDGDNDRVADITYEVIYDVCPHCGKKIQKSKHEIKRENERTRK